MDSLNSLLAQWSALAGFGALIAFIINILKYTGIVKEDQGQVWSAGLNLAGLILLLIAGVALPNLDIAGLDKNVADFVNVGLVLFAYIVQLLGSKSAHSLVKGLPGIGKSYS